MNQFTNKIVFLSPNVSLPEIIAYGALPFSEANFSNSNKCIVKAAEYDILDYSEGLTDLSWPPTIDELNSNTRNLLNLLHYF